jgi:hypothetical protein
VVHEIACLTSEFLFNHKIIAVIVASRWLRVIHA